MPKKKNEAETPVLTKAEEFYIENNPGKTEHELATDLGKPISVIASHLHRTKPAGRISRLLIREKGCVVMTEGASEAGDKTRKSYVTEQAIQAAAARGDYEEAARLQELIKKQRRDTEESAHKRNESYIHYIHKQ